MLLNDLRLVIHGNATTSNFRALERLLLKRTEITYGSNLIEEHALNPLFGKTNLQYRVICKLAKNTLGNQAFYLVNVFCLNQEYFALILKFIWWWSVQWR